MNTEFPYKDILHYCRKIVKDKKLLLEPEELLSYGYIKFSEGGTLEEIKSAIILNAFGELEHQIKSGDIQNYKRKIPKVIGDRCCKKCHQVKPITEFYSNTVRGTTYVGNICIRCVYSRMNESQKALRLKRNNGVIKSKSEIGRLGGLANTKTKFKHFNIPHNKGKGLKKGSIEYNKKEVERHKQWQKEKREQWNQYMRRRRSGTDKVINNLEVKHKTLPPYEFYVDPEIKNYVYGNKPKVGNFGNPNTMGNRLPVHQNFL